MHQWGTEGVDWAGISEAARFIATNLVRWGRVGVRDWKEKYGTVRVYCGLGWYQLHSITHPRHCFARYPQWLWALDCRVGSRIVRPLNWLVVPYHKWLYRRVYGQALKKWPHLRLEILAGADYAELLQPFGVHRIRTSQNGYEIRYDWHPDNWVAPEEEDLP
jgi:hypothetical protein